MKRVITIALGLAMFAAPAAPALGQFACVFDTTSGDWDDPNHWTACGGFIPDSNDTAKILNAQVCTIQNSDQSAASITIEELGLSQA